MSEPIILQGARRSMTHVVTSFVASHFKSACFFTNASLYTPPYYDPCKPTPGGKPKGSVFFGGVEQRSAFHSYSKAPLNLDQTLVLVEDRFERQDLPLIFRDPYALFASRAKLGELAYHAPWMAFDEEFVESWADAVLTHPAPLLIKAEDLLYPANHARYQRQLGLPEKAVPVPNGYMSSFRAERVSSDRTATHFDLVHGVLKEHAPFVLESERIRRLSLLHYHRSIENGTLVYPSENEL